MVTEQQRRTPDDIFVHDPLLDDEAAVAATNSTMTVNQQLQNIDKKSTSSKTMIENEEEDEFVYSPEEKKLLKKMNWITTPFIFIIVFLQYLDKITLNYSAVMNLFEDTNISEDEFGLSGALYYIGFLVFLFPNQYFMHRFPLSKYMGVLLVLWGATLACTALVTNFTQLAVLRCLLGFFESGATPSILMLIALLYRRREQSALFSVVPSTMAFGGAMGGLIGYGFLSMGGVSGLSSWKWYMIVLGAATSVLGCIIFIFLPDKANSRWFRLNSIEKKIVEERIQDSAMVQQKSMNYQHIWESVKELSLYCYLLIALLLNLVNGALSLYSTLILNTLGHFSDALSILLSIPSSVIAIILISLAAYLSKRYKENAYIGVLGCAITILGLILLLVVPEGGGILSGIFLAIVGPQYTIFLTISSVNIAGYTKKSFYMGTITATYCVGNFVGPLLIREDFAPRYMPAMVVLIVVVAITALLFLYLRWSYIRENRRRQQLKADGKLPPQSQHVEEDDLTDKTNLYFVYHT
ncbi:major facilitator superfamily domain-containing protein [Phascolomyces articulosus]|uniref:Major facilitator superfamily domain-containing protein n=1 Tax=Phascolomyces articulosus TaxID=60185 RepID=A0AAD5KJ64_9FUNG|nr:major facilitator superfamily domain-containing protein [Phascolomyces articulosus]